MGEIMLVAVAPGEEAGLQGLTGPLRTVGPAQLDDELAREGLEDSLDAVVVGTGVDAPLAVVQRLHRVSPSSGAVVLTCPESHEEVRRSATYAPDLPAALMVVEAAAEDLADQVRDAVESSRAQRRHLRTLAALNARESVSAPYVLAPASLGALLDHAPFGVLVGALDGRLVSWNRWAGDLLGLSNDAAGDLVASLFVRQEPLEKAFASAREGAFTAAMEPFSIPGPEDTEVEVTAAPTRLDDGKTAVLVLFQDVTARRHAERTRDRLAEHVDLLGQVSEALAGTLDVRAALRRLAERVVPAFADWVVVRTYDERGQSRRVVVRHRDPARESEVAALHEGMMRGLGVNAPRRQVVAKGEPLLFSQVTSEDLDIFLTDDETRGLVDRLGVASIIAAPMPGRDEVLGAMTLVRGSASPPFTEQELAVGVEVGRRAGVALDTLSLYARQRDLAVKLQRSLLTEPPQTEQAEIVVRYVAAAQEAQVGGDWYDAFLQDDGSTVLVIGDVMGHDTRAAAAMGQLRALLRGIGYTTRTGPAEMLSRLDAAIEGLRVETTATGLVVRLDPRPEGDDGPAHLCWSNAGHPPPIMLQPGEPARALEAEDPDLLLGVLAQTDRTERSVHLEPGGTLLLYTDGLIERRDESLDVGVARLTAALDRLAGLPLEEMCERLLADLPPAENDDDVALVAVRLRSHVTG
jgi:PAS domain-containing protein